MTRHLLCICALLLVLGATSPARAEDHAFETWEDFYRDWLGSIAREVPTELRASRVRGIQRSRDFELGKQRLRLFSPSGRTVQWKGKAVRLAMDWPQPATDGEMDLDGAIAYSYPDTDLLVCVQSNFQGLGLSGSFQNVRQLTLLFQDPGPGRAVRALRLTGYGLDCMGLYQAKDGWRITQLNEGEGDNEKVLRTWRLDKKTLTDVGPTVQLWSKDKIIAPDGPRR